MDPAVPVAETIGTFDALVAEGKIRAYGGSNVDVAWLEEALRHGRPDWAQNSYSLLDREAEQGVLEVCAREGLGFTPFSPLAGGWLTGKYRRGEEPPAGSRMTAPTGAVPPPAGRIASSTRSRRSRRRRTSAGRRPPRSRSPGCSRTRT